MQYTSWDRSDRDRPRLLAEQGPQELGVFDTKAHSAQVGPETWQLSVDKDTGATATLADGRVFRLAGRVARDKQMHADLAGRVYTLTNEDAQNWVISDAQDTKVAQFSGMDRGVRQAILEFEPGATLETNDAVALSWFGRVVLESRQTGSSNALLITLVLLTAVAALVWFT